MSSYVFLLLQQQLLNLFYVLISIPRHIEFLLFSQWANSLSPLEFMHNLALALNTFLPLFFTLGHHFLAHYTLCFFQKVFPKTQDRHLFYILPQAYIFFFLSKQSAHLLQFLIRCISNKLNCELHGICCFHCTSPELQYFRKSLLRGKF